MDKLVASLFPNVKDKLPELIKCLGQTMYMLGVTGAISLALGLVLGIILTVTRAGGILERRPVWAILDKTINAFRSIPFIILLALLIPVTRAIAGTAIGTKGALVPLVFGTVPFFARQVESALAELDKGLIEAAQSMGSGPAGIVFRVYLKESVPALARGATITAVSLVGLTAMAGSVGGGGLGDFAIRYGYQRFQTDVTIVTVVILLVLVSAIQGLGNVIIKRATH
jgi:D-methionine transport system permease protein